ncbi:sodium-dependent nutrient amino acid transporter 1-like [Ceratina calcarata]|uniref:Transporter n=1 Tax=Ceratina calcarata TaxID=156304 RepID=A0AAJ7J5B8_9HYME|nr:sodium-dependent nutrient amino acid transporter 1-like [Ceratina calcarata]
MDKIENGTYRQNGYTNESFQMDEACPEAKVHEKSQEKSDLQTETVDQSAPSRDEWGGGLQFLMACIATSVGLGNVWRFPFTAYENGGGAFLIPYVIVLVFVGKPFYLLEALLGQFTNKSCVKLWAVVPAMKGLGYGQAIAAACVVSYYCSLMGLTLFYLVASFQAVLPWSYCQSDWEGQCIPSKGLEGTNSTIPNVGNSTLRSSAELYFRKIVLNEYNSIEDGIGTPSWQLVICLFISWATIFAVLCGGVRSTGKAVYFLALFPYVVLIALLIRAVTLEGAADGILFFVTPHFEKLWQPTVWYSAITQCFFSLSVCFGPILTYSSYSNFRHKLSRDVMIVTTLDTITSLIAGFTSFGILGNLAHEMGTKDISTVVRGGTGLAFISYPEALSRFDVIPQLFSVLFFVMMYVLGTGSAVALCGAIFSILCDHFPNVKHWQLVAVVSVVGFLVSLVYITPGGQWFTTLVDYYGGTFVAIIVGVLEVTAVFWIYGLTNFLNDVEFMLGQRSSIYWRVCWALITPILMIIILVYTIATYESPTYDGVQFPTYALGIGWSLLAVGIAVIVGFIIQKCVEVRSSSLIETIKAAFRPDEEEWGPKDPNIRSKWKEFVAEKKFQRQGGFVQTIFR